RKCSRRFLYWTPSSQHVEHHRLNHRPSLLHRPRSRNQFKFLVRHHDHPHHFSRLISNHLFLGLQRQHENGTKTRKTKKPSANRFVVNTPIPIHFSPSSPSTSPVKFDEDCIFICL